MITMGAAHVSRSISPISDSLPLGEGQDGPSIALSGLGSVLGTESQGLHPVLGDYALQGCMKPTGSW